MALTKTWRIKIPFRNTEINLETIPQVIERDYSIGNAYIKILTLQGSKENINIYVGVFSEDKTQCIKANNYSFVPSVVNDSDNFIKQGYEYLKTLPEFEDTKDC